MSRVLVNTNLKGKKKTRKSGLMDKMNEVSNDDLKEHDKDHEDTSENEYEYSLSSQSSDEDLSDEGEGNGKKKKISQKEYQLVEMKFPDTLIKAQGKFRRNWDFLIIALSIYQAILIPFNLSFSPDEINSPFFKTLDSIIDIIFMVDIVFRFRTSYIDPISGEEVLDSFLIARRYVTGMSFYFDVISTIPFDDWFTNSTSSNGSLLQFLGLFKIGRIVRISNVIMNLNTSQEYKALMKVF